MHTFTNQLDELLDSAWVRDGDTFEYLSLTNQRAVVVARRTDVTLHTRGISDERFESATFTGTDAAQRAAAYARTSVEEGVDVERS